MCSCSIVYARKLLTTYESYSFNDYYQLFNEVSNFKIVLFDKGKNMQKCDECGATWTIERKLNKCPFCNADLKSTESINTVEDAFAVIIEKHGESVFQSEILLSLFADYAPSLVREKRIIKIAVESGAYRDICEAPAAERMNVINKYVSILKDSFFIEETWARKVLIWCMDALSQESSDKAHMLIDNTKRTRHLAVSCLRMIPFSPP